ncbi:HPr family phosphocarrier protein [Bacillaceae bacterium CLA-AA-H227]|uniref:HPr family phosphocarrier protein n=1 Tax=Robertmurraya yapensis (ex Hitch et al 2024) TaxID=3133160 RepID=A0ACC6SEH4_9BACI
MIEKKFSITGTTGFAQPATMLVNVAHQFSSGIFLEYQGESVDLKQSPQSIMDILTLGIKTGTQFNIRVIGDDKVQAIQSIEEYLRRNKLISH